jgi:hypothetical protein
MACTGDCPFNFGPCCIGGTCQMGGQCPGPGSLVPCTLGAECSSTDVCTGGIAGCTSNCQCLGGKWQAPCPTGLPQTGSACTPEGAECGYTTSTNACGADNCYCQSGAWNCEPSCAIGPAIEDAAAPASDTGTDSATDGGSADAEACAPSGGCTAFCVAGRHNVTVMVDGRPVTECCVLDDAGTD